jgi:hypothetical protein
MLNEFPFLGGWTIGLEKVRKRKWEITLISPDRKTLKPFGVYPDGFWAEWDRKEKFVDEMAGFLKVSTSEVREALVAVYG